MKTVTIVMTQTVGGAIYTERMDFPTIRDAEAALWQINCVHVDRGETTDQIGHTLTIRPSDRVANGCTFVIHPA